MNDGSDPLKPVGSGRAGIFFEKLHGKAFGPGGRIVRNKDFRISYSPGGIIIRAKARPTPAAPAATVQIKILHYQQMFGDYFIAVDDSNKAFQVAKIPELRCSLARQKIYGVIYDYTFPNNPVAGGPVAADGFGYVTRKQILDSDHTQFDNQEVTPPFCPAVPSQGIPADEIIAINVPDGTGVMSDPLDPNTPGYIAGNPPTPGTPVELKWIHAFTSKAWTSMQNQGLF